MRKMWKIAATLALCATTGLACDVDVEPIVEGDDFDEVDAEFRGGGISQYWYHLLLGLFVKFKAHQNGLTPMPAAPDVRPELVELGRALAFDKELSGNRDISCMTCHHNTLGTDDDLNLSIGVGGIGLGTERTHYEGRFIPRNAPPLFNLHAMDKMFWDSRVSFHDGEIELPGRADQHITQDMLDTFEFGAVSAQAMFPVTSSREMRGRIGENELSIWSADQLTEIWAGLMARLGAFPEYVEMFEAAYPGTDFEDMTFAHAANAIAGFEIATFEATESPWDEFLRGDVFALSIDELQGARHFMGNGGCVGCHSGAALTDLEHHNTALAQFGEGKGDGASLVDDFGRFRESDDPADLYAFRTPPLRNVDLTAPYGHAGQIQDLEEFIAHYLDPEQALLDYDVTQIHPLLQPTLLDNTADVLSTLNPALGEDFNPERVDEVTAFVHALTDPASEDLNDVTPASVPSGLPVDETVLNIPANRAGTLHLPITPGAPTGGREMVVWEDSFCNDDSYIDLTFDENANTLALDAHFEGVPYRPSVCYEYNPTTPYNDYPDCVDDGAWQIWLVTRTFNRMSLFYYDLADGTLLGNQYDVDPLALPATAIPVPLPVGQMVCTDMWEPDPVTLEADLHYDYDYDSITDAIGSGGVFFSVLPYNLFAPALDIYYTEDGLPVAEAASFRDFIEANASDRGGLMIGISLEPNPKPSYLAARDNLMILGGSMWPAQMQELEPPEEECGTQFQWDGVFEF